jgi:hypothetical protein
MGLAHGVFLPRVQRAIWVRALPRLPRRGFLFNLNGWPLSGREDFHPVGSAKACRTLIKREVWESIRKLVAGKLHGIHVTEANLNYHGSITLDPDHCEEAGILPMRQSRFPT